MYDYVRLWILCTHAATSLVSTRSRAQQEDCFLFVSCSAFWQCIEKASSTAAAKRNTFLAEYSRLSPSHLSALLNDPDVQCESSFENVNAMILHCEIMILHGDAMILHGDR